MKFPKKLLISRPYYLRDYFLLKKISKYTLMPYERFAQMRDHIETCNKNKIDGAIVELGCWKGGNAAYMKKICPERNVWAFDSFQGFPEFGEHDDEFKIKCNIENAKIEEAIEVAEKLGVKVKIVKGWFNETLPAERENIGAIAILRLDGDLYDSTLQSLDILYGNVSKGGYVVIDDYNFEGCRKAVYDFFCKEGIAPELKKWQNHGAYFFVK